MGAGLGFFFREGPAVDFPGVGQKYFCRGPKVAKLHFHHSKLRKQPFCKNMMRKCPISKYGEALALFSTPMSLKLPMTKRLRE